MHSIPFLSMFLHKYDHRRITWRWQSSPPDIDREFGLGNDPLAFERIFKMHYECFQYIVNWLVGENNSKLNRSTPFQRWYKTKRHSSAAVDTVVACGVLYLFGRGTEMEDASLLGVELSTFHMHAERVVEELYRRCSEVICFPPKEEQVCMKSNITDEPFPGALFAMDGTLCMLPARGSHNEFVGRKSLPQINVLVVCDWNMNLVHVDSNFTGRTQDNDMYMSSALHFCIDGENSLLRPGGFIIADEGFACREHILRPYDKRSNDPRRILYNCIFKSTRLLVENAIGAWKAKCPLLDIGMHKKDPKDLAKVILASAVLYQMWKMTNEKIMKHDTKTYSNKAKYIPQEFIGKRGVNLRDAVRDFLCDCNQEALEILQSYGPDEITRLQSLHVCCNKGSITSHFNHTTIW